MRSVDAVSPSMVLCRTHPSGTMREDQRPVGWDEEQGAAPAQGHGGRLLLILCRFLRRRISCFPTGVDGDHLKPQKAKPQINGGGGGE